jgi:DHA3 family tetracycline resistance protein-like MFS transporter
LTLAPQRASATSVYLALVSIASLASILVFTANLVFQVNDAGLNPLQLILIGTVWEATYFVFEIPTGIVADVYSRRLSVIIGLFISAAGLALIGAFPRFETIAVGYVVLGIGGTFTSGAQEAWVADEVGPEAAGDVFLRGSQYSRGASLIAIALAAGLGSIDIQIPQFAGAALTGLLGVAMLCAMRETGFRPLPRSERQTIGAMLHTVGQARLLVGRRPVLLTVLAVAAVWGAASEGFDRLYSPHFLRDVGLPAIGHVQPIVWFSAISAAQTLISILVVQRVRQRIDTTDHAALGRTLMVTDLLRIIGVLAFAFSGSFAVALATYLPTRVFVQLHTPLYAAWLNLSLESRVRATMLSVATQCDSIGQVLAGPSVGVLANLVSLRAGLIAAGLGLLPVLPLYSRAVGQGDGVQIEEVSLDAPA